MHHRFVLLLVLFLSASTAHSEENPPWVAAFIRFLYQRIESRAESELVGVIQLLVTIDRKGWPLECETKAPEARLLRFQPTDARATEPALLASAIERICRSSAFPPAPEEYYKDGRLKISIPLVLNLRKSSDHSGVGQTDRRK